MMLRTSRGLWRASTARRFLVTAGKQHYPVVVVGGGPVGMLTSLLLSEYRVPHCLLERRLEPTQHPQAHFMHARTLEIFQTHLPEVYAQILQEKPDSRHWRDFVYCYSVMGREFTRIDQLSSLYDTSVEREKNKKSHWNHTPANVVHLPQNRLERILREELRQKNDSSDAFGDIHYGKAVKSIEPLADGGTKINMPDGSAIHCDYLIGADGAHSTVRQYAGISMDGPEALQTLINVHFTCKGLGDYLGSTPTKEERRATRGPGPLSRATEVGCGAPSRLEQELYSQAEAEADADAANRAKEMALGSSKRDAVGHSEVPSDPSRRPGMLYFVFNERIVCVFVAHDPARDEWVCQIPVFPPYQSLDDYSQEDIIQLVADGLALGAVQHKQAKAGARAGAGAGAGAGARVEELKAKIRVLSTNLWTMNAQVASRFVAGGAAAGSGEMSDTPSSSREHEYFRTPTIFLAGDAAHRFPPSGGFGMNCGLQDAHNLSWKVARAYHYQNSREKSEDCDDSGSGATGAISAGASDVAGRNGVDAGIPSLLASYDLERRATAQQLTALSMENYRKTEAVARALGVDPSLAQLGLRAVETAGMFVPFPLRKALVQRALATGLYSLSFLREEGHPLGRFREAALRQMAAKGHTLNLLYPREDLFCSYPPSPSPPPTEGAIERSGQWVISQPPTLSLGPLGAVSVLTRVPHFWLQLKATVSSSRLRILSSVNVPALNPSSFSGVGSPEPRSSLLLLGAWSYLPSSAAIKLASQLNVTVVLVQALDERLQQSQKALQRRYQRPFYSRSRTDVSEMPAEMKILGSGGGSKKSELRGSDGEAVYICGEMSGTLSEVFATRPVPGGGGGGGWDDDGGKDLGAAVWLRPDGIVASNGILTGTASSRNGTSTGIGTSDSINALGQVESEKEASLLGLVHELCRRFQSLDGCSE